MPASPRSRRQVGGVAVSRFLWAFVGLLPCPKRGRFNPRACLLGRSPARRLPRPRQRRRPDARNLPLSPPTPRRAPPLSTLTPPRSSGRPSAGRLGVRFRVRPAGPGPHAGDSSAPVLRRARAAAGGQDPARPPLWRGPWRGRRGGQGRGRLGRGGRGLGRRAVMGAAWQFRITAPRRNGAASLTVGLCAIHSERRLHCGTYYYIC
jgi:hypothetical protein